MGQMKRRFEELEQSRGIGDEPRVEFIIVADKPLSGTLFLEWLDAMGISYSTCMVIIADQLKNDWDCAKDIVAQIHGFDYLPTIITLGEKVARSLQANSFFDMKQSAGRFAISPHANNLLFCMEHPEVVEQKRLHQEVKSAITNFNSSFY